MNSEHRTLEKQVARLTAEREGLIGEAERIEADYRKTREELGR